MSAIRRVLTVVLCGLLLVGCQEDGSEIPESQSAFPDLLSAEKLACEREGGRWGPTLAKTGFVCYRQLSDANKTCSAASDCQGLCLARSRTCSPIEPFFGCHEVVTATGLAQTLCSE